MIQRSGRIKGADFRKPRERAFAHFARALDFGLNTGQTVFGKMQLQCFQHADQNCSTLRPSKCFRCAASFAIQSSRAKRSFGFIIRTFHSRVQHERKQFFIAHQPRNFVHEIVELIRTMSRQLIQRNLQNTRMDPIIPDGPIIEYTLKSSEDTPSLPLDYHFSDPMIILPVDGPELNTVKSAERLNEEPSCAHSDTRTRQTI